MQGKLSLYWREMLWTGERICRNDMGVSFTALRTLTD